MAVTTVIPTPGISAAIVTVRFAPKPIFPTQGALSGTTNKLEGPVAGQDWVGVPRTACIFRESRAPTSELTSTALLLVAAISAKFELGTADVLVKVPSHLASVPLGSPASFAFPR